MALSPRGAAVVRVLLIVLGTILALFGLLLLMATIGITLDGDPTILFLLPFAIATVVGGIVIIVAQVKSGGQGQAATDGSGATRVVSSEPLGGMPVPTPTDPAGPAQAGTSPAAQPTDAAGATEDVAHLVFRSSDLFATLKDLVRHETRQGSDKFHLATMLYAAGVSDWLDAPACEGGRLSRNTHFWIRLATDELDDEHYDVLISAEAALSVNQDLPDLRSLPLTDARVQEATAGIMRSMTEQSIERPQLTNDGLRAAYHTTTPTESADEWIVRSTVCNAAECVRTPFRVVYDLRARMDTGTVGLDLELPRPRCMAIFSDDPSRQSGLARAYALRLAVLLARQAFDASSAVQTVIVNGHERGSEETILSLRITRELLAQLMAIATNPRIEQGFPEDASIRARFEGGWFGAVEPFASLDDPTFVRPESLVFPELDEREASAAVQRTCHARRICDLGINENAARIATWNTLLETSGIKESPSTEQAVSALMSARSASDDITVAEACTRTIQGLVGGTLDLDDLSALGDQFVDGSALDRAVSRSHALLDDSDGHEDPDAAVKLLESALAPIDNMGAYLDDDTNVYRYFGSVPERICHNDVVDEGGRTIRLVPDAYFNAHNNLSVALGMLGRNEEALQHADICLRLAPTSTYATMRKVRVLEAESRIYEAADLIITALRNATTARDTAVCHYRLAYMEWKLGREDLAVACYQRALNWDTEVRQQAREELDDLLESSPDLKRLTDEQADALLAREGIPLGCTKTDRERLLAAAVACMDDGALLSARPLMAALYYGMNSDDVVMGVYRSLKVPV